VCVLERELSHAEGRKESSENLDNKLSCKKEKEREREIKTNEAPKDVFHKLSGNPESRRSKKEKQKVGSV